MNRVLWLTWVLLGLTLTGCQEPPNALRVFVHAPQGQGTNAVDASRFLADWKKLLKQRGAVVEVGSTFPNAKQLEQAHVLVVCGADALSVRGEARTALEAFARRGRGVVVLHEGAVGADPEWLKGLIGGSVARGETNWLSARMPLSFGCQPQAICQGIADFDLDDRFARGAQLEADAQVIARAVEVPGLTVPQMWVFEKDAHRAFVALPGPRSPLLQLPQYRALILRGVAWAGKRDVDLLTRPEERAAFAYPEGGPARPDQAAAKIQVQSDFDLSLIAAEPLIVKPIALDWDAAGRLWVALMPEFPSSATNGTPRPALVFLSDTNADGRMDTRTVFYEGRRPITAFAFHRNGVIIAQAPEILWLRDADGDGTLDHRETLYTGFNTNDARTGLSSFRWGLDGWLYAAQGLSGLESKNITGKNGQAFGPIGPGILRFKPDGTAIERVVAATNNVWGFDFTWDGELFFAKAPGSHLSQVIVADRYLGTNRLGNAVGEKALEDHRKVALLLTNEWPALAKAASTGVLFTASAGAMVYEGGAWPMRYQGSYFVCEPSAHVVHEDTIGTQESMALEATRREEQEFVAATDPWFRPIQLRSGPDGAAYLLDFYSRMGFWEDVRNAGSPPGAESATGTTGAGNERNSKAIAPGVRAPGPFARFDCDAAHGRIWRLQHKNARHLDVPALDRAAPLQLVKSLEHPNRWVRLTAQRLLAEIGDPSVASSLAALLTNRTPYVRIHALWSLQQLGLLGETNVVIALTNNPHPMVQRAAFRALEGFAGPLTTNLQKTILRQFKDADERTKLLGLLAFSGFAADSNVIQTAIKMFPDLKDAAARSAILAFARRAPLEYVKAAFGSDKSEAMRELAAPLVEAFARGRQSNEVAQVILIAAAHPNSTEKLGTAVLQSINKFLGPDFAPAWSGELDGAIKKLFTSKSRSLRVANLPLATARIRQRDLIADAERVRAEVLADLMDPKLKDEERTALITNLMSVEYLHPQLFVVMDDLLDGSASVPVKKQVITELGRLNESGAGEILVKNYPRIAGELRPLLFGLILKRSEWALALLAAIENNDITVKDLDVLGVNRLRHYPDRAVADRAVTVFDAAVGAPKKDRDLVLERFLPVSTRIGNPVPPQLLDLGRPLYHQYCESCHKFSTHKPTYDWVIDITASGVPGAASVLTNILKPNQAVDPRWLAWNVTTTNGEHYFGAVGRETPEAIVLRTPAGDVEVKRTELASTNCTGVSLMPEGFEMLGEEALRNVLAYVMNKSPKGFKSLDLAGAFTADSRRPIFDEKSDKPAFEFQRFGMVLAGSNGIPFRIVNPAAASNHRNLIVLKGGAVQSVPQRVEVPVNAKATKLHVLGGVAGWGFPFGDPSQQQAPAAKLTLHYGDGETEALVMNNGDQFADYAQVAEVPGSALATNLVSSGQVRWFTVEPSRKAKIDKLAIESFNNHLAPVFVAVTVQE